MVQAVSDWPCTMESHIPSQASLFGICDEQIGNGTGFIWVFQFSSITIIPSNTPFSFICHQCYIILATDRNVKYALKRRSVIEFAACVLYITYNSPC